MKLPYCQTLWNSTVRSYEHRQVPRSLARVRGRESPAFGHGCGGSGPPQTSATPTHRAPGALFHKPVTDPRLRHDTARVGCGCGPAVPSPQRASRHNPAPPHPVPQPFPPHRRAPTAPGSAPASGPQFAQPPTSRSTESPSASGGPGSRITTPGPKACCVQSGSADCPQHATFPS